MKEILEIIGLLVVVVTVLKSGNSQSITCPSVPKGCLCSHKKKGLRIKCESLESVSFQSLPKNVSLEIDLTSNMLKTINNSMFPKPNNIRKLLLADNEITKIEPGTFDGFKNLKKLDLSRNYLFELKEDTFSGLRNLSMNTVNLGENRILSISKDAFKGLMIDKLYLRNQQKVENNRADLIVYADDFLSQLSVRMLDLSNNNLLCDCNLEWLVNWANRDGNILTETTSCKLPRQLDGVSVETLKERFSIGGCGQFKSSFSLPFFQLYPARNQVVFENDSAFVVCQSTWTSQSFVIWYHNGIELTKDNLPDNVTMKHQTDLQLGIYVSILQIHRFKGEYKNLTCKLHVYGSGVLSATLYLHTIKNNMSSCSPYVQKTQQGYFSWPTTYANREAKVPCPYGGMQNSLAFQKCDEYGKWSKSLLDQCFFSSNITRTLQNFHAITKSREVSKIRNMAKAFKIFFRDNVMKIESRYDLYFLYRILHDVMSTYKQRAATEYSGFFWSSLGYIAKKHVHLPTLQDALYGKAANSRFQYLLEAHVEQEFAKSNSKYVIDNHKVMAAYSNRVNDWNNFHCYITSPHAQPNGNLTSYCFKKQNWTLDKVSDVRITFSSYKKTIQVAFIALVSDTFFQYRRSKDYLLASPIVGLKIGELNGTTYNNFSQQIQLTFQSKRNHLNPKLMYWSFKYNTSGEWLKTKCKRIHTKLNNVTAYGCLFDWQNNLTYLAFFTGKQPPIIYPASYLEVVIYVAASISAILLLLTFIIYAAFRSIRFNRGDVSALMNLCAVLFMAELTFVFGIHRTDFSFLCQMVAVGLHYLLLTALIWLGCGATILIILLRKKDRIEIRELDPVVKYYLIAWGIPVIIVGISIAFNPRNYGTQHYCWLNPDLSLGGFIAPASFILLIDLILICYVHALTNKCYPDLPNDENISEDENLDPNKCHTKICKYKIKPKNIYEKTFPKKDDLLLYIRASLSFILWISLMFTLMVMMFTYQKENTAVYLYYLFTYGSAGCNLLLGFSLFWFHCYRRKEVKDAVANISCSFNKKKTKDDVKESLLNKSDEANLNEGTPHSPAISLRSPTHIEAREPSPSDERADMIDATSGVFGTSDQFPSDASHIHSVAPVVITRAQVFEEGHDIDSTRVSEAANQTQTEIKSQTDCSENERQSVGKENSIGDCSLTSSRNRQRIRANNPDIPENLKQFVPDNWRPAQRRRKPKQASYYPYFMTDLTPNQASVAYSSNTSSLNSTTVGGVPLYINKKQTANNLAMYNELFNPKNIATRLAPIRQPSFNQNVPQTMAMGPHIPQPIPMGVLPFADYPGSYATSDGSATNRSDAIVVEHNPERGDIPETVSEVDEEESQITNDEPNIESEQEDIDPIVVAPILYIPIPHLTKKQFVVRSETSV